MTETPCLRKTIVYEQKFVDFEIIVICVSSACLISGATRTANSSYICPAPSVFSPGFLVTFVGEWN